MGSGRRITEALVKKGFTQEEASSLLPHFEYLRSVGDRLSDAGYPWLNTDILKVPEMYSHFIYEDMEDILNKANEAAQAIEKYFIVLDNRRSMSVDSTHD